MNGQSIVDVFMLLMFSNSLVHHGCIRNAVFLARSLL